MREIVDSAKLMNSAKLMREIADSAKLMRDCMKSHLPDGWQGFSEANA